MVEQVPGSGGFRIIFVTVFAVAALMVSAGCDNITEFEAGVSSSLTVYSGDLEVISQVTGITGGVQTLIRPGLVYVVTTDGEMLKYDSETLELLDTYIIGVASAAGYSILEFSPAENSVYIVGATGKILELALPECEVTDEFSVCQFPVAMSISTTIPSILYVADGVTDQVFAVRASTNSLVGTGLINWPVTCIEASNTDTTLIGTEDCFYRASFREGSQMRIAAGLSGSWTDIAFCEKLDAYAGMKSSNLGVVEMVYDPDLGIEVLDFVDGVSVGGNNHMLSFDGERYVYLLSYMGDSVSRILKYDMAFRQIVSEEYISGFPMAVQASSSGLVYVLVVEDL